MGETNVSPIQLIYQKSDGARKVLSVDPNFIIPKSVWVYDRVTRTIKKGNGYMTYYELPAIVDLNRLEEINNELRREKAAFSYNDSLTHISAIPYITGANRLDIDAITYSEDSVVSEEQMVAALQYFKSPVIHIDELRDQLGTVVNDDYRDTDVYYDEFEVGKKYVPTLNSDGQLDPWWLPKVHYEGIVPSLEIDWAVLDYLCDTSREESAGSKHINLNKTDSIELVTTDIETNIRTRFVYTTSYKTKTRIDLTKKNIFSIKE